LLLEGQLTLESSVLDSLKKLNTLPITLI